jgi:hypothetical protein
MKGSLRLVLALFAAALALAIVPFAAGGRPTSGGCPPGFDFTSESASPLDNHNGDNWICTMDTAVGTPGEAPLYIDNAVQRPD